MLTLQQVQTKAASQPSSTPMQGILLYRKCACGQHTSGSECEACRQKREGTIQRAAVSAAPVNSVPPIVYEVLNSPGQPLDTGTRAFMEPRFGYDFSQVRVHTDARAAESTHAVNALAYTVGNDVVFGAGRYESETSEGRKLLAHELTHVVQQAGAMGAMPPTKREDPIERAAQEAAQMLLEQDKIPNLASTGLGVARAEPELASTKSVHYNPNERANSKSSPGMVDDQREDEPVLFNFGVNEDHLKPEHEQFLKLLVERFHLRQSLGRIEQGDYPQAYIRLVEGHTDLVDTEAVNEPLRQRRAEAVVQFMIIKLHVPWANFDVVRGAPAGSLLSDNATPEGRAYNRAVVIKLEEVSQKQVRKKPGTEPQREISTRWSLTSNFTTGGGYYLGVGGGMFLLKNLSTGESRSIAFMGGGIVGGLKIPKLPKLPPRVTASFPSETSFETILPCTFEDFEGGGWMEYLSVDIIAIGYQVGYAHFDNIETTEHKGIWIGGPQAGGLGVNAALVGGTWKLLN